MNKDPIMLQNLWEFRRKNEEFNSSSDDESSNSSFYAHKTKQELLLPSMIFSQETNNQIGGNLNFNFPFMEAAEKHIGGSSNCCKPAKNVKNRDSAKKNLKQKSISTMEAALWDDLNTFRESIVGELKGARENMFAKMKDSMEELSHSNKPRKKAAKKQPNNKKISESGRGKQSPSCKPNVRVQKKKIKKTDHNSNDHSTVANQLQRPMCFVNDSVGSLSQINSTSLCIYNQNGTNMDSQMPYNTALLERSLQANNNNRLLMGTNNGTMSFSGGNLAVAECFIANSMSSHMGYRRNTGLSSFRCQDYKEHFLQN